MSAFMVNDGTIDRAVSAVLTFKQDDPLMLPDALGAELIKLNMEALRQRYGDKPLAFTYKHRNHNDHNPLVARYKAVMCLTYQCSEGNVPDTELYKLLEQVEQDLMRQCADYLGIKPANESRVMRSAAYEKTPWDFDD